MLLALGVCGRGRRSCSRLEVVAPRAACARSRAARADRAPSPEEDIAAYDPGRERRAEARARELLRSCVNEEDWEMYRDLGFLRVWGAGRAAGGRDGAERPRPPTPT